MPLSARHLMYTGSCKMLPHWELIDFTQKSGISGLLVFSCWSHPPHLRKLPLQKSTFCMFALQTLAVKLALDPPPSHYEKLDFRNEFTAVFTCPLSAVHRGKKVVLWESVWFYGLIRKSIIKERSEGDRGRREGDIKGAGMFCPRSAGLQHI